MLTNNPALRHARGAIAHMIDHVRIVADQHHRQAIILFEIVKQVQDLGLYRHIQRRRRLIQQQDLRLQQQGAHNGHALTLSAGQLMRIAIRQRRIQPDMAKARVDAIVDVIASQQLKRFRQRAAQPVARMQRCV